MASVTFNMKKEKKTQNLRDSRDYCVAYGYTYITAFSLSFGVELCFQRRSRQHIAIGGSMYNKIIH